MGFFTDGYKKGEELQLKQISPEEYNNTFKSILKTSTYNECVEWINGFYKAMIDYDIASLKSAFLSFKEEAEGNKESRK